MLYMNPFAFPRATTKKGQNMVYHAICTVPIRREKKLYRTYRGHESHNMGQISMGLLKPNTRGQLFATLQETLLCYLRDRQQKMIYVVPCDAVFLGAHSQQGNHMWLLC